MSLVVRTHTHAMLLSVRALHALARQACLPRRYRSEYLVRPRLDVAAMVKNAPALVASAKARMLPEAEVAEVEQLPERWCALKEAHQRLRTLQAQVAVHSRVLKDPSSLEADRAAAVAASRALKADTKPLELEAKELERLVDLSSLLAPNTTHPTTPAQEPVVVEWLNCDDANMEPSLDHRDHKRIAEHLGFVDFEAASVASGRLWYYLQGAGADLEQALVQLALDRARAAGFTLLTPPLLVRQQLVALCGFRPRDTGDEQQVYTLALPHNEMALAGTAEIPLAGWAANRTFAETELPRAAVGVNRAYRAEAGARGRDTRGLYRVHEFTKVELFVWCLPHQLESVLARIVRFQLDLIRDLELPAKVLDMPANDMGAPAYKKYDIECWMPGRGKWGELTLCSNCTDFQARRLGTRFGRGQQYVHTLNGTALAVPRVIAAILENMYDPALELVAVPKVLQPYLQGRTVLTKETTGPWDCT